MWEIAAVAVGAPSALAAIGGAAYAANRWWRNRLTAEEWDILKAVRDSRIRHFDADMPDLLFYIQSKAGRIVHTGNGMWAPDQTSLRFSTHYRFYCQVLADKGHLTKLDSDPSEYKYELSPKGERFLKSKRRVLERRNYKGSYDDVVRRELERRKRPNKFHGEQQVVDDRTGTVDLVVEFPISPARENPCDVLCMVHTLANRKLLDTAVGSNAVLELDARRESLYLSALGNDGTSLYRVVYRHERDDEWSDVWLDDNTGFSYGGGESEEAMEEARRQAEDDRAKELREKQNKIREAYYGLPHL